VVEGCRIIVSFDHSDGGKHRNYAEPHEIRAFEAQLTIDQSTGRRTWTMKQLKDQEMSRVIELRQQGYSFMEIQEEMGISKSKAERLEKLAMADGTIESAVNAKGKWEPDWAATAARKKAAQKIAATEPKTPAARRVKF